jgi:hypothetical protein
LNGCLPGSTNIKECSPGGINPSTITTTLFTWLLFLSFLSIYETSSSRWEDIRYSNTDTLLRSPSFFYAASHTDYQVTIKKLEQEKQPAGL